MFCYIFHNEKFFVLKITSQCSRVRIWTLTPCFASFQCSPTRRTVNNAHFCSLHVLVKFKCYYVLMLLLELCRINWSNHHVHLKSNDEEGDSTLTFVQWIFIKEFSENGFCSHSWGSRGGLSHTPLLKKHSEFDKDSCLFEAWIHFNATDECLQIFDKIGLLLKCMNIWSNTKLHKAIKPFYWDLIFYPTYCSISITLCCWFRVVFGIMKFDFVFMYILEENMW